MSKMILAGLVAVMVFCGYLIFDGMRRQAKQRQSMRMRLDTGGGMMEEDLGPQLMSGELSPGAKNLAGLMRGMGVNVDETTQQLELRFARAGIDSKDGPVYYLFFQRVMSIVFGLLGVFMMATASGDNALLLQFCGFLVLVLGIFGPKLYIQNKIEHREKKLLRAFPDTLDLLLICVESGLALDAALTRVCNELARAYPEMTAELNRTRLELALLNDRPRALMNLGERTGMVAFRSLVVALIQSEKFGTSLTDTLRVLSEDFRLQRLMNAEAKAARLPVLLTIPLIFLLMPAFLMIVLGPAIVSFVNRGQKVTGAE